ncbi:transposase [uncultured Desulfovibrio sp.]|uniref:transposase n=1 Tax=uncultured Desulfovibrio sp. TaxID=167968 RepID=UPI00345C345B
MYGVRHGPQWKDAPRGHGPYKTLHNRFFRWSRMGVFKASLRSPQKRRTMMDG